MSNNSSGSRVYTLSSCGIHLLRQVSVLPFCPLDIHGNIVLRWYQCEKVKPTEEGQDMGMSQNRNSSSSESLCRLICMTVLKSIANQTRGTKAGRSARLLNLGFPRGASEAPLFFSVFHPLHRLLVSNVAESRLREQRLSPSTQAFQEHIHEGPTMLFQCWRL